MMELSVAEILKCQTLKDAKVVAGRNGLARSISSVTVGEVPDIADWLRGGEVVLSTLYAVSKDSGAQLKFVENIIESGAAALLVKPGRFVKEVDPKIIKVADEAGFPLIEVLPKVRWTEIVREIYDLIIRTEAEIRLRGDFVDDLVTGQFKYEDALLRRASFLGADLSKGCLAMIVDLDNFEEVTVERKLSEQEIQRVKRELFNAVDSAVRSRYKTSLVSLKSDNVIILLAPVGGPADEFEFLREAKALAKEVQVVCRSRLSDFTVSVGLGRYYSDLRRLDKTFHEAQTALGISRRLGETQAIVSFEDVGTYKLLLRVLEEDPEELERLYQESVARLVAYDMEHRSDLVKTLEFYLKNNQNLNQTAEGLFTHRHTVRYRLERIASLTGLDVKKTDDLEKLNLGLKAMRLLSHR
jgi:DNA-binding PucR family transcriptional regulator